MKDVLIVCGIVGAVVFGMVALITVVTYLDNATQATYPVADVQLQLRNGTEFKQEQVIISISGNGHISLTNRKNTSPEKSFAIEGQEVKSFTVIYKDEEK